jgi:hypothetical protein
MMTLQLHSLMLEVAAVQQQLHLLCGFNPTSESVLWQLLNRGGMNNLFQLSVSVSFTLRVICLHPFPYMLSKVSIQSIRHASHVLRLAVSRNRSGAAKPRLGLNGLCFSAAVSAHLRWVIVSIYGLSSPM